MPEKRKKYDREFREGAVRIVEETGKPIAQVARDLGVHEGTLGNWVARAREAREGRGELTRDDVDELKRLRSEVAELRMERDVLKRSVVLWVNEDEVSVARFIADQRTKYPVPHTFTCALLGISVSWFYKWLAPASGDPDGVHTGTDRRRCQLDEAVRTAFGKAKGLHGSPRLVADLRDLGWTVSEKTVADSMRRQGLIARKIRRRGGLTRQDKTAPKFLTYSNVTSPRWLRTPSGLGI
nr:MULTISPECIES: transposase [unclassified Mycobacterium]